MKNRNLKHNDNWKTPDEFYFELDAEFHFDFDPCPLDHDMSWDGLEIGWGHRNYINPRIRENSRGICKKAIEESKREIVCDATASFNKYEVVSRSHKINAKEIRFVRGRIAFEGINTFGVKVGKGAAPMHDSMIVIFGY